MESRGRHSTVPQTPTGAWLRNKIQFNIFFTFMVSLICVATLTWAIRSFFIRAQTSIETLEGNAPLNGWKASSSPRSVWLPPLGDSNGYLVVHCHGGVYKHRSEISDAVIAARALNATLVVPRLGAEFEFHNIYMVSHFINSLRYDVKIVERIPQGNVTDPCKVRPPKVVHLGWLMKVALPKLRKHGVLIISHLKVAMEDAELQRLQCRVSFRALRFTPSITKWGNKLVDRLQRRGYFIVMHVHVESDALVLSPTEVSVVLSAMGHDTSTKIFLTAGEGVGRRDYIMKLYEIFRNAIVQSQKEDDENDPIWYRDAIDYFICLRSKLLVLVDFNFVCDLVGHRLYDGFRSSVHPNRALRESLRKGNLISIRQFVASTCFSGPHVRVRGESFSENPFPECFCSVEATDPHQLCPPKKVWVIRNGSKRSDGDDEWKSELDRGG